MAERIVTHDDDEGPVEQETANPGEKRDTGKSGPKRKSGPVIPEGDPNDVRLASDVAREASGG